MKKWYTSKTLQGQIITAIGLLVELLHLPLVQDEVNSLVSVVFTIAGIAMSIYGRVVTKGEKITF